MVTESATIKNLTVRVPAITTYFWIIKVLATTVGETFSDYLNVTLGWGLGTTSLGMSIGLLVALAVQFGMRRYVPVVYWLVVVLISIVGTLLTDSLSDHFHVALISSTLVFAALLAITFVIWYRMEGSLAMKTIVDAPRESFYWLAILWTFALGTAAGDLLAEKINWGYGYTLLFFVGCILAVYAVWKLKWLGDVTAFWIAYILTRPLGASTGDFLSQPKDAGGLGLGTNTTSLIFLGTIVVVVAFLSITHRDRLSAAAEQ